MKILRVILFLVLLFILWIIFCHNLKAQIPLPADASLPPAWTNFTASWLNDGSVTYYLHEVDLSVTNSPTNTWSTSALTLHGTNVNANDQLYFWLTASNADGVSSNTVVYVPPYTPNTVFAINPTWPVLWRPTMQSAWQIFTNWNKPQTNMANGFFELNYQVTHF